MRIISVINQKGGVGKTTTAFNIAHAQAVSGKKVLLIDLDPQSHLTDSAGLHGYEGGGVDEVMLDGIDISEKTLALRKNLLLLPAGSRLGEIESLSKGGFSRGRLLDNAIQDSNGYDYVIIDCPPSAGLLSMNALLASSELLMPVSSDYLSLHGLSRLLSIVTNIEGSLARKTKKWVVVTRFHENRKLAREVREKLAEYFPQSLLATPIRETVALAECPSFGKSIFDYQKSSRACTDHMDLANDIEVGNLYVA